MKCRKAISLLLVLSLVAGNLLPAAAADLTDLPEKATAPIVREEPPSSEVLGELPELEQEESEVMTAELSHYIHESKRVWESERKTYVSTEDDQPWGYDSATGRVIVYEARAESAVDSVSAMNTEYPTSGVCGDNLTWTFDTETGTLTISGTGDMYDYGAYDPAPWNDFTEQILQINIEYGVTYIGRYAFAEFYDGNNAQLFAISLPDSVVKIGCDAFCYNKRLESIHIPDSVTEIGENEYGEGIFFDCSNLKQINVSPASKHYRSQDGVLFNRDMTTLIQYPTGREGDYQIPSTVNVLKTNSFACSKNLTSITIPGTVHTIESSAFWECKNLENLEICNGVVSLGSSPFLGTSIRTITLPASVQNLDYTFQHVGVLENIHVDPANPNFSSLDGVLFNKNQTELLRYSTGRRGTYVVPDTVTYIDFYAFAGCEGLTGITFPSGLTTIGMAAFSDCTGLTEISFPDTLSEIRYNAFEYCIGLKEAVIPGSVTNFSIDVFRHSGLRELYIQEGVQVVSSVGNIGKSAFPYLETIVLPQSVTDLRNYTFWGCSALERLTIPENVEYISGQAFMYCDKLGIVEFKGHAPEFNGDTFEGVTVTAYYPANDPTWTKNVRQNYGGNVTWVKGSAPIASGTCGDNLTWELDDNGILTIFGTGAMSDYENGSVPWRDVQENITAIKIEDGVTTIGANAFAGITSAKRLRISDSVVSIGDCAFYNCDGLVNVGIRSGVTEIGEQAFANCESLMNINFLGDSHSIGIAAFASCANVREIHFWADPPTFSPDAFNGITATAYYPEGNPLWTDGVMQNYGGALNWVMKMNERPCSATELTPMDYLAFSNIAYMEFGNSGTIGQNLADCWDENWSEELGITYGELCAHIAQWEVYSIQNYSDFNGFYAVAFRNQFGEVVIAYRGSVPPDMWVGQGAGWDAWCDWMFNDLPMELGNTMGIQFNDALEIYNAIADDGQVNKIVTTGHSLGGAWADLVSAYTGCQGVSMNAVSMLDVAYTQLASDLADSFTGVDHWNFVDHTNKNDVLAGMFEHYLSTEIKPYIAHDGNINISENVMLVLTESVLKSWIPGYLPGNTTGDLAVSVLGDIAACHGLESLVTTEADGTPQMTEIASSFSHQKPVSNFMLTALRYVDLGTSGNDRICNMQDPLNYDRPRTSYGGSGDDFVVGSSAADTLIGGKGNDTLDGRSGNDVYIYYKEHGVDTIRDVAGRDTLKLCGFLASDRIEVVNNPGEEFVEVRCNGSMITKIMKQNRQTGDGEFAVQVIRDGKVVETYDLTNMFAESTLIDKIWDNIILFCCPVDVEILDGAGNVVLTLEDGVEGTHYTQCGNFYVFQEENGGYGKLLDLMEGYSARAVGVDTGTMQVACQAVFDSVPSGTYTAAEVPVYSGSVTTVEQSASGQFKVNLDTNGDGIIDEEIAMVSTSYGEAVANGTCGESLYWNLYIDGTLVISGSGEMGGFQFEAPWYEQRDSVTKIVIQEGVTTISDYAFYECAASSVTFANSVISIGTSAFSSCDNLTEIYIPAGVEEVKDYAFAFASSLKNITVDEANTNYCSYEGVLYSEDMTQLICCPTENPIGEFVIPEGVTTIMSEAFCHCPWMDSLRLPDSLTTICMDAIYNCFNLSSIVIPANVTNIETSAFSYNFSMTEIIVAEGNPSYCSQDGILFNKEKTILVICPQGKTGTFQIPSSVETIEDFALSGCWVTEWIIPGSVNKIGEFAMYNARSTIVVRFLGDAPQMSSTIFAYSTVEAYYPEGNPTWTEDVMQQYDGTITWIPYNFECTDHTYEVVVTEPTCTEDGYTTYSCSNCKHSYKADVVPALGHSFTKYISNNDAICTEDGTKTAKCDRCDVTDTVTDTGSAKGHSYGNWYVTKEAKCETEGQEQRDCKNCEHYETRVIASTGHDYTSKVTAPTCSEQGYTTYTCACGDSYVDDYVDALEHDFSQWYTAVEPTCTEDGQERRDCIRCEHYETNVIEAKGHNFEDGQCTNCGQGEYHVKFRSTSLALGGNIGLNFIVELSENLVQDESAFIRFTYQNYVVEIPLSEGEESVKNGVTRYTYSCPITSRHMTDTITAQIYNANGPVGDSAGDSVRNYCDRLFKVNNNQKLADLMHAMLNYGAAAQIQFNYKTDDLANSFLTEEQKELHYVDLSDFAIQKIGKDEGIKAANAMMILDSETTVRIYYRLLGDKPIDAYTICIDGQPVEPTLLGDRYYVEIQDIAAHRLDDMHTITAGGETLIYGPMSFAYTVLTTEPEGSSFYNLALALYAYSAAAEAYIK